MSPRWTIAIAAVLTALALGIVLYWGGRRDGAAHERPKTEAAQAQAAVAQLETDGARATAQRVEITVRQRDAAQAAVTNLTTKAIKAEDADAPLDPDRALRLRNADRELCLANAELCAADRDAG